MSALPNAGSGGIVAELAEVIVANRARLSEIDGLIGDGDHGVNMAKGFSRAADRIAGRETSLGEALAVLSDVLLTEIGGSMGPLYGVMFEEMAGSVAGVDPIDAPAFAAMLRAGLDGVVSVGAAAVGDKTLVDCLQPAVEACEVSVAAGEGFEGAVEAMDAASVRGRDSTVDLVARLGRSARLGERSRGVPDAGATSCCLILQASAGEPSRACAPDGAG